MRLQEEDYFHSLNQKGEGKVIGRGTGQLLEKLEVISGSMRLGYFTAGEKDDCLFGQCGK